MAEGNNVAQYLAGKPLRAVSVHYTIEAKTSTWREGQIVRILPEGRISGSVEMGQQLGFIDTPHDRTPPITH